MFKAIKNLSKDSQAFQVKFEPKQLVLQSESIVTLKLLFKRGDAASESTKTVSMGKTTGDSVVEFNNEAFTRECTFFMDKGQVQPKFATVRVARVISGKDVVIAEKDIDLALYFGSNQKGEIVLDIKPEGLKNGVLAKKISFNCVVSILKPKDQEAYKVWAQAVETKIAQQNKMQDLKAQVESKEKTKQEEFKTDSIRSSGAIKPVDIDPMRKTMPVASPRNDFYNEARRGSQRGTVANNEFDPNGAFSRVSQRDLNGRDYVPDFDPTGNFEEEDSDEDGDPFERMQRDRQQSIKHRLSDEGLDSKLDSTRMSSAATALSISVESKDIPKPIVAKVQEESKTLDDPVDELLGIPKPVEKKVEPKKNVSVFASNAAKTQEKLQKEKLDKQKAAQEKLEKEKAAKEKADRDRIEKEKAEFEAQLLKKQKEQEEEDRILKEKAEKERIEKEAEDARRQKFLDEQEAQRLALIKAEEEKQAELERQRLAELEQLERQRIAEEERLVEFERQRIAEEKRIAEIERLRIAEQERVAEEELKAELERQRTAEEERKAKLQSERLAEIERIAEQERKDKIERERLAEFEKQRIIELEIESQRKIAVEKQAEQERQRLKEIAEQKRLTEMAFLAKIAEEKRLAEEEQKAKVEQERLEELERRKRIAEKERQAQAEQERLADLERQRLAEEERKAKVERERLVELERQRVVEEELKAKAERERLAELERQKIAEEKRLAEEERKAKAESDRQAELERLRIAEEERKAKVERERLLELERQRVAEEERKAKAERERLAELERQKIAEEKRLAEEERKAKIELQRLAEIERQRIEEEERQAKEERERLAELERQKLAEERERLAQIERQRIAEEERLAELERERLAQAEKARIEKELELERQRQEAERIEQQNIQRQKEAEELALKLKKEAEVAEANALKIIQEKAQKLAKDKEIKLAKEKAIAEANRLAREKFEQEQRAKKELAEQKVQEAKQLQAQKVQSTPTVQPSATTKRRTIIMSSSSDSDDGASKVQTKTLPPKIAQQRAEEAKRLEALKKAEEEKKMEAERIAFEQKLKEENDERERIEAQRIAEEEEAQRIAEEKILAEVELQRKAEQEKLAEMERQIAEEKRLAELERQRIAEEQRQAELERQRIAEEQRLAELERQRIAEEKRQAEVERQRIAEEERLAKLERQRIAEEERLAEIERKRLAELERLRIAEEERLAELERQRIAEEERQAELERQRIAEEERLAKIERERIAKEERQAELERQRIAEEQAELERQELEIKQLQEEIKEVQNSLSVKAAEHAKLKQTQLEFDDLGAKIKEQNDHSEQQLQDLAFQKNQIMVEVHATMAQIETFNADNDQLETDLQEPKAAILSLDAEILQLQQQLQDHDTELSQNIDDKLSLENELKELKTEIQTQESLQTQMKETQMQQEEQINHQNYQIEEGLENQRVNSQQLERFENEARDLEKQIETIADVIRQKKFTIEEVQKVQKNLKKEYEEIEDDRRQLAVKKTTEQNKLDQVKKQQLDLTKVFQNLGSYMSEVEVLITKSKDEVKHKKTQIEKVIQEHKEREIEELKKQVIELEALRKAEREAAMLIAKQNEEERIRKQQEENARMIAAEEERVARKTMEIQALEQRLNDDDDYGSDEGGINFDNIDGMVQERYSRYANISPVKHKVDIKGQEVEKDEDFDYDQLVREREQSMREGKEENVDIVNMSRMSDHVDEVEEVQDDRFDFDTLLREKSMSMIHLEGDNQQRQALNDQKAKAEAEELAELDRLDEIAENERLAEIKRLEDITIQERLENEEQMRLEQENQRILAEKAEQLRLEEERIQNERKVQERLVQMEEKKQLAELERLGDSTQMMTMRQDGDEEDFEDDDRFDFDALLREKSMSMIHLDESKRLAQIAEKEMLVEIAEQERLAEIAEKQKLADIAEQELLAEIAEQERLAEIERLEEVAEFERLQEIAEQKRLSGIAQQKQLAEIARLAELADKERLQHEERIRIEQENQRIFAENQRILAEKAQQERLEEERINKLKVEEERLAMIALKKEKKAVSVFQKNAIKQEEEKKLKALKDKAKKDQMERERLEREQLALEETERKRIEQELKRVHQDEVDRQASEHEAKKLQTEELQIIQEQERLKKEQMQAIQDKRKKSYSVFNQNNLKKAEDDKKLKALKALQLEQQRQQMIEQELALRSQDREKSLLMEEFEENPLPEIELAKKIQQRKFQSQNVFTLAEKTRIAGLSQVHEEMEESQSDSDSGSDFDIYAENKQKLKVISSSETQSQNFNDKGFGAVGPSEMIEKRTSSDKQNGSVQIAQKNFVVEETKAIEQKQQTTPIVPIALNQKEPHQDPEAFSSRASQFRASMDRSRESFFGMNRDGSYRATLYDKQGGQTKLSKKAKVDLIVRELLVSLLTQRDLFTASSDFEVMEGFRVFEKMLQADSKCHEAMFGLAKLNYRIKRFETAEYWLVKAYTLYRDIAYRVWLGFTYFKLQEILPISNPKKAKFASYAVKNLQRCAEDVNCSLYANFGLLYLSISVLQEYGKQKHNIEGLLPVVDYAECLSQQNEKYEATIAQALLMFATEPKQRQVWIEVLNALIESQPTKPEAYYALISQYMNVASQLKQPQSEYQAGLVIAEKLFKNVQTFQNFSEKLLVIQLYAKCLMKAGKTQKALFILQEAYVQTPHYICMLYLFGKYIVKSRTKEMYNTAIGALSEVARRSAHKRRHNCMFFIGMAYELKSQNENAMLNYTLFSKCGAQVSEKLGPLKKSTKETYIAKFKEIQLEELNIVSIQAKQRILDCVAAVKKSKKLSTEEQKNISLVSPTDPLQPFKQFLISQPSENQLLEEVKKIIDFDTKLDKLRFKVKVLLAYFHSGNKPSPSFTKMYQKLLTLSKQAVTKPSEFFSGLIRQNQLAKMTLKMIKNGQTEQYKNNSDYGMLVEQADRLIMLLDNQSNDVPCNEWASMIKHSAKLYQYSYQLQNNKKSFLKAITALLKLRHLMPAIDAKLANPRLPIDLSEYVIQEMEFIDFFAPTNCEFSAKEQKKKNLSSLGLFKSSSFFEERLMLGTADENEIQEVENHLLKGILLKRRSLTPLITVVKIVQELNPSERRIPQDASEVTTKDVGFSVQSNPDYLLEIAKICLDSKCYQDLALQCLKEYISILNYYKEFNGFSATSNAQHLTTQLVQTRKLVIIMMSRCLVAIPSAGSVQKAKVLLEDVENVIRQDYIMKKASGDVSCKVNYEMFAIAKTELELALKR